MLDSLVLKRGVLVVAVVLWLQGAGRGGLGRAQQCKEDGPCKCVFDDGSGVIDINSLASSGNSPKFKDVQSSDGFKYSYNPCSPFNEQDCNGISVCQISADGEDSYPTGDTDSATWSFDGTDVIVTYDSVGADGTERKTAVTLKCVETASTPSLDAVGETDPAFYELTLTTQCACKNGCGGGSVGPSSGDEGLSPGSILLIVVFVLLLVYLVGGAIFNRQKRGATGTEMVPNIVFWKALPGLVKDGCCFTVGKVRRKKTDYDEVK